MKTLLIEWQRLVDEELQTCPRCASTEREIEKAAGELDGILAPFRIAVSVVKRSIDPETFRKDALQSNRVRIAGKALEEWLGAATGRSRCCETCGDAECRTVQFGDAVHEDVPAELIVRAGITAAAQKFGLRLSRAGLHMPAQKSAGTKG